MSESVITEAACKCVPTANVHCGRLTQSGGLMPSARLAVDIGGTFTDLALEHDGRRTTIKVLTTPAAPEQGVMAGVRDILQTVRRRSRRHRHRHPRHHAGDQRGDRAQGRAHRAADHQGFRDVIAMGNESRYDQYDLNIVLPEPLVPRHLRLPVPERLDNDRQCAAAARRSAVRALVPMLQREQRRKHRRRLAARLRQSGARTPRARHPARGTAGHSGVAVQRSIAGNARVGAVLHHRRQCLCAADDGALSAPAGGGSARSSASPRRCS